MPKGWEVVQDRGQATRRAAPRCWPRSACARGTIDVQGLSADDMYEMNEQGVVEQIDYSKLPNAKNLIPAMKYPYGVGHIYSGKVGALQSQADRRRPTGFADTLDPKHGNKLGIIDIQYQYTMVAAALASGGKMSDFEPGKERLIACKKAGARIYPTNEAFAQALKTEEIASASCGRRAPCNGRTPASTSRPWRPRKACRCTSRASSCRRTRPTRTAPTPISTP